MADEHDVTQILEVDQGRDVLHERLEVRRVEVGPIAEPGQRRRVDLVAHPPERPGHPLPAPTSVPTTVDQHERPTHVRSMAGLCRSSPSATSSAPAKDSTPLH